MWTTGVGKSTIANLINRFYDPQEGAVIIDGVDIRDVTLSSLRDNISMVLQDTFLFNGTVYENIEYGWKDAKREDVIAAAKAANAHDFIEKMENGYDTYIGERGVLLSGGQRQRIAIARAILRDSPILILDEATSALDTKTEKEIQAALNEISKERTTIMIAHRLSTTREADLIVVLEGTGIAEMGTHDELIAKGGIFARLHGAQAS
ncbi:ABC transporter ATP-binding protein [Lacrimispora indolis]|uniref:ABC transporter ATP-binding protein n=1 Tax=Lacrimispora indolis TaxID=69825 RepID=UPI001FA7873A|nr:ATP-binding cassette domain-containing protein [[Clostridium] methoxybenzovorans]